MIRGPSVRLGLDSWGTRKEGLPPGTTAGIPAQLWVTGSQYSILTVAHQRHQHRLTSVAPTCPRC